MCRAGTGVRSSHRRRHPLGEGVLYSDPNTELDGAGGFRADDFCVIASCQRLFSDPSTEFQHPRIKERVRSLVPSLWSVLNVLREDRGYLDVVLPLQTALQRCHPCVRSTKQGPDEDAIDQPRDVCRSVARG
jgi:hypothetical protein